MEKEIKRILKKYNIKPNKRLGQNFLIDKDAVLSIVASAGINKTDTVIEVGGGTGTITKELAKQAGRIIVVEKDQQFIEILQKELAEFKNVEIVHADILQFNVSDYIEDEGGYKLVGAPPYYLTARLFRMFLEEVQIRPRIIAFIIQKEVAEKIIAKAPHSNLLALSVQLYGSPSIEKIIPSESFLPQPKIDSALLLVNNIKKPTFDEKSFFSILKAGFCAPRKQLGVNISNTFHISREESHRWLKSEDIDPTRRAQTLSIEEWGKLSKNLPTSLSSKSV